MANLLEKASIILTPTAYDDGKVLAIKPSEAPYGDFDFTRNSSATRVNAQGLVEDVQILSSNLVQNGDFSQIGSEEVTNGNFSQEGSELVTNGDFATDSDWAKNPNWTISGGTANCDGTSDGSFFQGSVIQDSKQYLVTYTISNLTQGGLRVQLSGTQGVLRTLNGTYTEYITSGLNPSGRVSFDCSSSPIGSIDNVSVKEVGQDWTLGTGWSIGEDKAIAVSGASTRLEQSISGLSGKTCKVSFTLSDYGGSGSVYVDFGSVNSDLINTNGIHIVYGTFDQDEFELFKGAAFNGSITNISVKEVGQNWSITNQSGATSNIILGALNIVTDGAFTNAEQTSVLTSGNNYRLTYTIISNAVVGNLQATIGNASVSILVPSIVGTHTVEFTSAGNAAFAFKRGGGSLNTSISNISVIEITDDTNLPRINYSGFTYQDSLGSELITNGSFDVNGNWSNFGTPLVSEQSSARYYTSPFSWYVNGDAFRQGIFSPNNFTLTNGKTYNVSLWVYALDGAEILSGLTNTDKSVFTSHAVTQNEWTNITYSAIANATSASYISILTSSSTLEFYIDNVSVKEYLGQEVVPDSGCGAWLFEPQSSNLVPYSEDFSQWIGGGSITISNSSSVSSPSNSNSVGIITGTVGTASKFVRIDVTTTSLIHTYSAFFKYNSHQWVQFASGGTSEYANFDIQNGVVGDKLSGTTSTIDNFGNGWYRCTLSTSVASAPSNMAAVVIDSATSARLSPTSSVGSIYIWGVQLEQQSYPTSYIPTEGTIKTRNQDVCINGGDVSLINSSEGVLYAQIAALANDGTNRRISLSDGTNVKRLLIFFDATNSISALVRISGVTSFGFTFASDITQLSKIALKWKQDDFALWVDGLEVGASTSGNTFAADALNTFTFTDGSVGSLPFFGNTKALGVWKEALTDAELRSLTYPTPTAPTFDLDFNTIATDFTFTRNSEATFVNAQGLIQSTNELGAEVITNGDFSTDGIPSTTSWSLGWYSQTSNVLISGGKLTLTNSSSESTSLAYATDGVSSLNVVTINKTYKLQYRVIENNGVTSFKYYSAGGSFIVAPTDLGVTHTIYIKNFTNQIFLFQNATTNSSISIDNVSIKEYITETNTPRLDYSTGAEAFLLEPQRTNLYLNSEPTSNEGAMGGVSYESFDWAIGFTNCVKFGDNSTIRYRYGATAVNATQYAVSAFVIMDDLSEPVVSGLSSNGDFSFAIGGSLAYSVNPNIYMGNNIWKVSASIPSGGNSTNNGIIKYTTQSNKGFRVVGYQLELGSYATSYIPTSGTIVTRNQELCVDATPVINSEEGVLYAEVNFGQQSTVSRYISLSDGSNSNRVIIGVSANTSSINTFVTSGGVTQANMSYPINISNTNKVALKYKKNNFALFINGIRVFTDSSGLSPIGLNSLNFNQGNNGAPFSGNTKGLKYYPKALADVELQDLTTI